MGETADWMDDQAFLGELNFDHKLDEKAAKNLAKRYNKGKLRWTMRDGKVIKVKKMTDEHVVNTLNMLMRNKSKSIRIEKWIEIFRLEYSLRHARRATENFNKKK